MIVSIIFDQSYFAIILNMSSFPGSTDVCVIGTPNGRDDLQFSRHTFILQ